MSVATYRYLTIKIHQIENIHFLNLICFQTLHLYLRKNVNNLVTYPKKK